ncbi:hypothetical protein L6452_17674 [Arctium lappa]|uniref:Uncharacterized protein n=1 Tax=Arctium lappa TaxID=4217 RepID=A0ACB9C453_ARCLA|nr:hypothetical protein L6452_17674 [Arctium lappa]
MAFVEEKFLLFCFVFFNNLHSLVSSQYARQLPIVERLTDRFPPMPVTQGMATLFGASNIQLSSNGSYVDIGLDKSTGSGLVSKNTYYHGFFSASIKLPKGISSGVVLAFYMSNSDVFPHNHDELDFEFLGHESKSQWVLQTNMYANGSIRGREERINLWFNPTHHFHQYSILWNHHHTVFLVDNIPVREVINIGAMSYAYPLKPMSLYATIWDGSNWATEGGKYPTNYKYAPFVASLGELKMEGCVIENTSLSVADDLCSNNATISNLVEGEEYATLSKQQRVALNWKIIIDCTRVAGGDDSKLYFSVDNKRVLVVKHLQWKLRGHKRVEINCVHIQISWDVHNWLLEEEIDDGYALFMFRFEKSGFDYHEDNKTWPD